MPIGTTCIMDKKSRTGCMDQPRPTRPRMPTTRAMTTEIAHTMVVEISVSAIFMMEGVNTWEKGAPVRSDIMSGISTRPTAATPKEAHVPVRAAMWPSTDKGASISAALFPRGAMRKDEAKKEPTDKAMRTHAMPRKSGRPKVVMRPGSGMPKAARESAKRNREIKPATRPAISIAAI